MFKDGKGYPSLIVIKVTVGPKVVRCYACILCFPDAAQLSASFSSVGPRRFGIAQRRRAEH